MHQPFRRALPDITFPPELPVSVSREVIADAIRGHQVVIVAGETGSGKTTQLPKICLALGRGAKRMIGHTQPRRLAARTVSHRIARELGTEPGSLVGYQVRFTDQVSDETAIKLMTDGILLAEIQRDRLLRRYDTIIIDEAHERSLNIDFLLGYLKRILPRRPDLKLIVTSATIDVAGFSRHFGGAPVIEVSGRGYPVETHYEEPGAEGEEGVHDRILTLVREIDAGQYGERGDVLVFLSGEREIRELARELRHLPELEVLPLYARLSQAEQERVFDLSRRRGIRVVLATNVAETSLTVPGIRYVIDPGLARISRYSYRTKLQRLPVEPVSRASADQRRGRCGRVGPGVCIRLYGEADYERRPEFTDPEIRRTNLAAVILQMLTLGLGEVERFPFIDPPDPRMVRDGYRLLEELGAVSAAGELTTVGRAMARLPVDPRLGRMVLAASQQGCLPEILVIASALAIQDPRERPAEKQQQADQMHARFRHPRSDFMAWLGLWRYYEEQRQALSQNQLRKLCQREFLSFQRMREWRDVHGQLRIACRQQQLRCAESLPEEENYRAVHLALLAGLPGNIGQRQEGRDYLGSRNRKLQVFPGSSLARKPPPWLVAAEIVETSSVYAREVGAIEPEWVLEVNPGLLRRHYYEPRWQPGTGRAVASERVTLYGLTVADRRTVHYGPIAPGQARELLIREGLVAGRYRQPPPFLRHNLRLVREVEALESKVRRRDILVDEEALFAFYDERLPPDICTTNRLQAWLKRDRAADANLRMAREHLLARDPGPVGEQFPDHLQWEDLRLRLSYQFEPGGAADGVSVTVPVALLNRVPRYLFDWLVPGLLREKCVQLVKNLPKEQRKRLVPVPDFVDRALAELRPGDVELAAALAASLGRLGNLRLAPEELAAGRLDDFYRMNIRVVDAEGRLLAQGRELLPLVERFREETRQGIDAGRGASPTRRGIRAWDFDALPGQWRFRQAGSDIVAWPALVDHGETVSVELCDYEAEARLQHRLGVLRLLRLHSAQQVRYLRKQLLRGNEFNLLLAGSGLERNPLLEDLVDAAFFQTMRLAEAAPRSRVAFEGLLATRRAGVIPRAVELETLVRHILEPLAGARRLLAGLPPGQWPDSRADVQCQLARLLPAGALCQTPALWLEQFPRYLKALRLRLERLPGQYPKDRQHTGLLGRLEALLWSAVEARPHLLALCGEAARYRWMLEELRVSFFAQSLGTRLPVSEKRLLEQWQAVDRWQAENPY